MNPDDLRNRATRYRTIATRIDDAQAMHALHELADEYEALADTIEAQPGAEASRGHSDDCG